MSVFRFLNVQIEIENETTGAKSYVDAVVDLAYIGHAYSDGDETTAITHLSGVDIFVVKMQFEEFRKIFVNFKQLFTKQWN